MISGLNKFFSRRKPDRERTRGQGGFTLVEILVAIFIFALVVPTVYAAYRTTVRITSDAEYGDAVYSMARNAMGRFIKDLESISAYQGGYRFKLMSGMVNDQPVPMLTFTSSAHLAFSGEGDAAGLASISYYVEKDEGGDYTLMRRDSAIRGGREDQSAPAFVVCENVKSLGLKFYDNKGKEHEFWNSDSEMEGQKKKAPSAVLIDLQLVNPNGKDPFRFMTRVKTGAS